MAPIADSFDGIASLDELVARVRHLLGIWIVMISRPESECHVILAKAGQSLPDGFEPSFPIAYSICRFVADMNFPLVVDDAFSHPLLVRHPAVTELGVAAYRGVPVMREAVTGFHVVLSALSIHRRDWSRGDMGLMNAAADQARGILRHA